MSTFINTSLAKGLSKQSLEQLVEMASLTSDALYRCIAQCIDMQNEGRPPAKLTNLIRKNISNLTNTTGIMGGIIPGTSRKFAYFYIMPEIHTERLVFTTVMGKVNGRTQILPPDIFPIVEITKHSIERMHLRLNTTELSTVYGEILFATPIAFKLYQAAEISNSKYWPLPSPNGIFVASFSQTPPLTTLITWLPYSNLSTKWTRIITEFQKLPINELMDNLNLSNVSQFADILKNHDWLQKEHEQSAEEDIYWNSNIL